MKIGIAGPLNLNLLQDLFGPDATLPATYSFALTSHLARALHERGHKITLFALSRDVTTTRRIDGASISAYICPQRKPRWQMLDLFRAERHALRDAMRASGCEVIHAHWMYEFGSAGVASGLPCIVTAHDIPTVVLRYARHPYWWEKPLMAWPVLRKAKHITAVSPYAAQALRPFIPSGRDVSVIPNGPTPDVFELHKRRKASRQAEIFRFASVLNGWSVRKNGVRLIQAFSALRQEFGNGVELLMFGDGHGQNGPAEHWATERHIEDGVRFLGPQPYGTLMARLSREVDVLVHPSREETQGMAVTEAMAIGLPVIGGAKSGAIPWVLAYGEAGLLVNVLSPESIASGMRSLLKEESLRASLAESGRNRAIAEFRLEAAAAKYEGVLAEAYREQAK